MAGFFIRHCISSEILLSVAVRALMNYIHNEALDNLGKSTDKSIVRTLPPPAMSFDATVPLDEGVHSSVSA